MSTDLSAGSSIFDSHAAIDAALTKLGSLGRLGDAQPIIDDVAQTTNYNHIGSDETRTPDAKLDMYAAAYAKNMDTVARRLSRAAAIAETQHGDDSATVFGCPPFMQVSARDAADRANNVVNPRDRQAALTDAISTGDDTFARALTKTAIAAGDHVAVNQYIASRPDLEPAIERLWDAAHTRNDPRQFGLAQYLAKDGLKPSAISHLAAFQISARAQRKASQ